MKNVPKAKTLPHYGSSGLISKLITAKKIKEKNILAVILNKVFSRLLLFLGYHCPINSLRVTFHRWRGVKIGKGVFIGMHVILDRAYPEYITIKDYAMIAGGNHLLAHSRAPEFFKGKLLSYVAPIILEEYCWLGIESIVLAGSTVGKGSVVTAGSVVAGDIDPNVIVRGNPAEVIKKLQ